MTPGWIADGERVLWSGAPDWSKEQPRWMYWRRRLIALAIALALAAACAALGFGGQQAAAIVAGVFAGFAFIAFIAESQEDRRRRDSAYFITDRRIVIERAKLSERFSARLDAANALELRRNGAATNVTIRFGSGEEDYAVFFALADPAPVEQIFATHLRHGSSP
jgi:hypothetical protein